MASRPWNWSARSAARLMHPSFVGSIFQPTATAYRLKYDGDGGEGSGLDDGPDVGNKALLEKCI